MDSIIKFVVTGTVTARTVKDVNDNAGYLEKYKPAVPFTYRSSQEHFGDAMDDARASLEKYGYKVTKQMIATPTPYFNDLINRQCEIADRNQEKAETETKPPRKRRKTNKEE